MMLLAKDFKIPDDGFFQLSPLGDFPAVVAGEDGKLEEVVQRVDAAAVDAMLRAFNSDAKNPNFGGVLVDYDHFSSDPKAPSRAGGWIMELQNRADGLYGKIRFTPAGEEAVRSGEYRFCSPVWDGVRLPNSKVFRPTKLASLALTNDPNLKTLKPLSNRSTKEGAIAMADTAGGAQAPANPQGAPGAGDLSPILAALGLKPDAKAADALQAINALIKERDALKAKGAEAQAESDLAEFGDSVANREEVKKQLIANREGTLATLRSLRKPGATELKTIVNRSGNALPGGSAQEDKSESARCARIANRAAEIQKTHNLSYRQAYDRAAAENPKEG